ncbi:MAG: class I SAM-dependent methyltransferase [Planctomycetota bacterium]|nr:class I SAM-dependent methyltransferase [Planctomycetota bacterium]
MTKRAAPRAGPSAADIPNRYDLYELAVQEPGIQTRFLRALHGGRPTTLCEDFCGPASLARHWTLLDERFIGAGVDRDAEPLAHARRRAAQQGLDPQRLEFVRADVRRTRVRADIIAAFNFAVCELHDRASLTAYLRRVRGRLLAGGVFVADLYEGGAGTVGLTEASALIRVGDARWRYQWEQRSADPLTGMVENAIHFLPARRGTPALRDAFVYRWRLWSVPELRDALREAGFARTEAYLSYGDAIDGDGDPVPMPAEGAAAEPGFVAYVVGRAARTRKRPLRTPRR